jgi:UDP-GlcNAc3NAcA epimerase
MVYGDTNSTLAGALAAVKLGIPVAHVEAGLRSFNLAMPEEVNRILTDRISRWLFTPTETASCHLRREGVEDERIISVGDVMYDVALYHGAQSDAASEILLKLRLTKGSYALATIHRAENTDRPERLAEVVGGLVLLAETIPVVWPLHPRTRGVLAQYLVLQSQAKRLCLVDPVGYLDMVQLERNAGLIVTDSGGVQKEAFFHQVPCVTLRAETEWIETVELGWNRLCPTHEPRQLAQTCLEALHTRGRNDQPYGAGDAAQKIAAFLATRIGLTP